MGCDNCPEGCAIHDDEALQEPVTLQGTPRRAAVLLVISGGILAAFSVILGAGDLALEGRVPFGNIVVLVWGLGLLGVAWIIRWWFTLPRVGRHAED